MDYQKIKNRKLREVLSVSKRFSTLESSKQSEYFEEILKLDDSNQELLAEFFENENKRENLEQNELFTRKNQLIQKYIDHFKSLKEKTKKKQQKDKEIKNRMGEEEEMEKVLGQLEDDNPNLD